MVPYQKLVCLISAATVVYPVTSMFAVKGPGVNQYSPLHRRTRKRFKMWIHRSINCFPPWLNYLQLDAWFCHRSERVCLPVDLFHLLPHHHVETGAVLVPEDKSRVVVVRYRVYMKRPFKIHAAESSVTWWRSCHTQVSLGVLKD